MSRRRQRMRRQQPMSYEEAKAFVAPRHAARWGPVRAEADAILAEQATTNDPLEKAFIAMRALAHVCKNIPTWEEL